MAGLTPKAKLMPQTPEEFQYMGDLYEKALVNVIRENGVLREKINRLDQKVSKLKQLQIGAAA